MFYQWARKMRRYYLYFFLGLAVLATVIQYTGLSVFSPSPCDAPPDYRDEVPAEVREVIDLLYDTGVLYCRDLREGLLTVDPSIYWASDGMNSVVFFQAVEGETLAGVGLSDYTFGDSRDEYYPSRQGDARHPGFSQEDEGRRAWRNQAEGDSPVYYYRVEGAPGGGMASVYLRVRGPAIVQEGVTDRNFLQDLERVLGILRREESVSQTQRLLSRDTNFLIEPKRWELLSVRDINPALLDEEARMDYAALRDTPLPETILYQTVQSLTGSTVWVAGVVSGTTPAMILQPRGDGEPIEPLVSSVWLPQGQGSPIAHFAFPRQPEGSVLEAKYWIDGAERDSAEADRSWPVAFPFLPDPDASPTDEDA